ncbi:hypothetical protein KEM52_004581 [Ascosphaera acerosa]|nr:hypothetical protein KEM52_004581 [Ascosphaera acerosa]
MTVIYDHYRPFAVHAHTHGHAHGHGLSHVPASSSNLGLEDKFNVIKEVGDGSFGSVVLARTRTAGAHIAARGSTFRNHTPTRPIAFPLSSQPWVRFRDANSNAPMPRSSAARRSIAEAATTVAGAGLSCGSHLFEKQSKKHWRRAVRADVVAIKTMKKTFDSFEACLDLREVVFLRNLPPHAHLVPALDIFLDPLSKKLHIAMEFMDGNLYQLMKARDHHLLDQKSVKSILFQIMSGLKHIHTHGFFHRDIKPENILISTNGTGTSSSASSGQGFAKYSQMITPPSTPTTYTVKIADFGLAREINSKQPYTTYVSTRWYRAPEVLLRAGEYSAPVDIWAVGAMAVEVATLKPLFPGRNEVDQVWRVCEIMGSPGNWYSKSGNKIGGGEWKDGVRLAGKLGFSFPKAPLAFSPFRSVNVAELF